MKNPKILKTDTKFLNSPDAGNSACICSRCGKPISENETPVRTWAMDFGYECRYHETCIFPDLFENKEP